MLQKYLNNCYKKGEKERRSHDWYC